MPTVKLTPSSYYLSNSSYLSVSNASNMYDDTDSTNYATVTNSRTSTTSYYIYVRGFDFSQVPSAAIVSSFTIKLKGNYSGGYSQSMYLYDGTSTQMGSASSLSTSVNTRTFTCNHTWEEIVACGSDFGIRINCRRNSRNTTSYIYIYGAEIDVTYTLPVSATVTSSLQGDGTIVPSGAYSCYEGDEYTITITPTDKSAEVSATKDGVQVQLVAHGSGDTVTIVPDDVTTSGIQSGASYMEYAVGHSAESPSSSGTSSNAYSSSGSTGHADYSFDFSNIPSNATIESVEVRCYGHRENATIDSTHVSKVAVYVGNTNKGEEDFPSTSNSMVTLNPTLTRSELSSAVVRHTVGYYGGLVLGISFEVTYSTGSGVDHYTYTYTVDGDATIVVTIGGSTRKMYKKINGTWTEVKKVYKKINNAWVEQTDITNVFNSTDNFIEK